MLYEILYRGASKEKNEEKFKIIKDSILKNGFENTANIYSESETSKLGGKIGWINENQLSKELRKKISNLEIGEFTNPINVPGGLLIIKLFEKEKKETVLNFEGELKKIISYEKNKQFNQFSIIYFNKIKARTTIYES